MLGLVRFWRRRTGDDFRDEILAHIALETDRLVAEGWASGAAADEARRRFGNVGQVGERYYDRTHLPFVDDLVRDIHYACRSLAKDKAYVLAAVGALSVGLAANIALFSLFAAVALQPLPVPSPERLVSIVQVKPPIRFGPFSIADYFFYRANTRTLGSIAIAQPAHLRLAGISSSPTGAPAAAALGAVAEPVIALFVTTNYFETFGIHPLAGRLLRADDEGGNGAYAALISDNYWNRRFARDPSVIGQTLIVSGIRATIVGVTPRDFAGVRQEVPDLWITLSALGDLRQRAVRDSTTCCELVARLADGYSVSDAQAELTNVAAIRRRDLPPSERQMTVRASPAVAFGVLGEQVRPLFAALQVAMFLVLFIACANVASLMLGRAAAREREIGVRLAIGAGRARLVRQLLTEGVVVAIVAGALAALLTGYALTIAAHALSSFLSRDGGGTLALDVSTSGRVAIYAAAVSIGAGILLALAPSLQASRADLVAALRMGGGGNARGIGRLRSMLIASQIALSVALLIGAAGLARSSERLVRSNPGFHAGGVLSVWLTNPRELALSQDRARQIEDEVRRRLAALPQVQSLAVASRIPLGGNVTTSGMLPTERATQAHAGDGAPYYPYSFVSSAFFSTLGIPLLRGRTFTDQEVRDSAPVAVISDSMARALWPHGDALGKRLALHVAPTRSFNNGQGLAGSAEIVGIVGNVRGVSMTGNDVGDLYLPKLTNEWSSRILLRTRVDPAAISRDVTRIVHDIEPALPVSTTTMTDVVATDGSVVTARASAGILAAVGLVGLLLASVGVYGMVSYAIRQKQREIGIRMALGAHGIQVLAATLRGTATWIARGVVAGVGLGIIGIKLTNAVLVGASVSSSVFDPASIVLVPLLIGSVAIVAASLSARKAAATNPAVVLRSDG